jgi:hypothetical protein
MTSSIAELITLLTENERAMEELTLTLAEERRCITDMDLAGLAENGYRKEAAMARVIRVKAECGELMGRTGTELGLKETRTLSTLIAAAAATDQAKLRPLQRRQVMLAKALEEELSLNRRMLDNSIGLVESSMALFGRLLGGCDTYGARGRITSGRSMGSILRREI